MAKSATLELPKESKEIIDGMKRKYVYVLAEENPTDGTKIYDARTNQQIRGPKFRDYTNIILRSTIIWDGSDYKVDEKTGKTISGAPAGLRQIRYYDGCTTIFVDEQPQNKEMIDQFVQRTTPLFFQQGFFTVYGHQVMLKKYMDFASRNEESPYRIPTTPAIYKVADAEAMKRKQKIEQDQEDKAIELSKKATEAHMRMHCLVLMISDEDYLTGQKLSEEALRVDYRNAAKENPDNFIKTYEDKTLEIQYWIRKCLENGILSTTKIPNKVCWAKNGQVVMDISGIHDPAEIVKKLTQYSQLFDGADFLIQLKAANQ